MPTVEGFYRVRTDRFAFHCEASTAYPTIAKNFLPHEICDTQQIPFRKNLEIGMVVGKSSPFTEKVKRNWAWMRETGIVFKHKKHWVGAKPECLSNAFVTSVGFDYVGTIFTFLFVSYIVSFAILVGERIHGPVKKMKIRRIMLENRRAVN